MGNNYHEASLLGSRFQHCQAADVIEKVKDPIYSIRSARLEVRLIIPQNMNLRLLEH